MNTFKVKSVNSISYKKLSGFLLPSYLENPKNILSVIIRFKEEKIYPSFLRDLNPIAGGICTAKIAVNDLKALDDNENVISFSLGQKIMPV